MVSPRVQCLVPFSSSFTCYHVDRSSATMASRFTVMLMTLSSTSKTITAAHSTLTLCLMDIKITQTVPNVHNTLTATISIISVRHMAMNQAGKCRHGHELSYVSQTEFNIVLRLLTGASPLHSDNVFLLILFPNVQQLHHTTWLQCVATHSLYIYTTIYWFLFFFVDHWPSV